MLENFKWICKVITLLLASGRIEFDDLHSVMDVAAYYHGTGRSPDQAFELIHRDWPDLRPREPVTDALDDTPEEKELSWEERNRLPVEPLDNEEENDVS